MNAKTKAAALSLCAALVCCACASHEQRFEQFMKDGDEAYGKPNFALADEKYQAASREAVFLPKTDARPVKALRSEARALAGQNRTDEAIAKLEAAQSMASTRNLPKDQALAMEETAIQYMSKKQYDEAFSLLTRAIDLLEKSHEDDTADCARIRTTLGSVLNSRGEYDVAIGVLGDARDFYENHLSDRNGHQLAITLHQLAFAHRQKNEEGAAMELDEKAKQLEMQSIDDAVDKLKPKF